MRYRNKNNIVDSSGWLEYFADAENADFFAPYIEDVANLIIPSISIHEVFKHVLRRRTEKDAFECIEIMLQGTIVDLDVELSLSAAKLGVQYKIPMAGSIILATGFAYAATIWTQDADFEGLPQVKYIKK